MKKWSLWKTIISVISGVVLVAGVTVGGIFLAGGFKEKKFYPEAITFNLEGDVYNANNSQFEATKDFTIVINGSTTSKEEINQKQITLSLNDGSYIEDKVNGVIYDSVITVPRTATLGVPFTVKLNMSPLKDENGVEIREGGNLIPWISGGLSKIVATSQNPDIQPISVKIAVDVPVYSMDIKFYDLTGNELKNNEVTSLESFTASATFLPVKSEFAFSDNTNTSITEKRKKLAYFESLTENVKSYFENDRQYFSAGEPSVNNQIKGYAFRDAATQIKQINQFMIANPNESNENLYKAMLSYLAGVTSDNVNTTKTVDVVDASIKNFTIAKTGATLNMTVGKVFTLSVNRSDFANDYLGTTILSTNDDTLISLLKNVALRFEYTTDNLTYHDATGLIDIEGGKLVTIDGLNYYLPNANVLNINDANWKIYTASQINLRVTAVLLLNLPDKSGYEIFANDSGNVTYEFALNAKENVESGLAWTNTNTINMTLDFDGSNPKPASKPLGDFAVVPDENVYKTVVFFAYFGARDEEAVKAIIGDNYEHAGKYQFSNGEFMLYALKDKEITVCGTGEFEILFATVMTDKNNTSIFDEKNQYIIVKNIEDPVKVVVSKTLYENSVTSLDIKTDATLDIDNNYYINNGSENEINLTFAINQDSYEVFKEKVDNGAIDLNVFASEINITSFFDLQKVVLDDITKTATYTLKPKASFSSGDTITTRDITLSSVMLTDNTTFGNNLLTWAFPPQIENKYIFYTSRIDKVEFKDNINLNYNIPVEVVQSLLPNGDYSLGITYMDNDGQQHLITDIANWFTQFNVTTYDQHGKTEIFSNDWSYATDDSSLVLIAADGKSYTFPTAKGTARLNVVCSDGTTTVGSDNYITFDIDSSGITKYQFDNSKTTAPEMSEAGNFNGGATINKYGQRSASFDLNKFVNLFLDAGATNKYNGSGNLAYAFSQQFIGGLSDEDFNALFVGTNAMLSLYDLKSAKINVTDKASLGSSVKIAKISINHNFSSSVSLELIMSDENVNVNVSLNILNNVLEITGNTNVGAAESDKLYAASEKVFAGNVAIKFQASEKLLNEILVGREGYLTTDNNGNYVIVFENPGAYLATISTDGKIRFNDFWDEEIRVFKDVKIYIDEDGPFKNKFSPFVTFNFTVRRNLIISSNDKTYLYNVTDEQNLNQYITIGRIEGSALISDDLTAFEIQTNHYMNIVEKKFAKSSTNIPVFGYNQDYFTLNVIVKVGENEVASLPVKFSSGLSYTNLAEKLLLVSKKATTEKVGNVSYIYMTNAEWTISKQDKSLQLISRYNDNLNAKVYEPGFYSVQELNPSTNVIKLLGAQINNPLFGLNNSAKFLIFKLSNASGTSDNCIMIVPVIITSMGDLLTVYGGESSPLQTSLSSTDDLIEKGKYLSLAAGKEHTLATPYTESEPIIPDETTGKHQDGIYYLNKSGRNISISEVVSTGSKYALVAGINKDDATGVYRIQLNSLSKEFNDVYVTIEVKIVINGTEQKYYYLIKVTPNVQVNNPIYPFVPKGESGVEYITAEVGNTKTINLTENFDSNALNAGLTRFSITLDGTNEDVGNNFSKYPFTHSIVSVYDGINTFTTPQEYLELFEVLRFEGNNFVLKPKVNSVLTITIKRHYTNIVCSDINYTFILNGSSNYKMDYATGLGDEFVKDPTNSNNAIWNITQGQSVDKYTANINLRDITNSGESSTGNIIYNKMKASFTLVSDAASLAEGGDVEDNENLIAGVGTFRFDSKLGKLTYAPANYLGKDNVVKVNFYTEQGHIGSLTINIQSSVSITFKAYELVGGQTIDLLTEIIDQIAVNSASTASYGVWDVSEISSQTEKSLLILNGTNRSQITALTTATVQTEKISVTLKRSNTVDPSDIQTYNFSMDLTIKANIVNQDGSTIASIDKPASAKLVLRGSTKGDIYAQEDLQIGVLEILKDSKNSTLNVGNALYSVEAISGGEAMDVDNALNSNQSESIRIKTKDVASNTRLQVRIKIELFKDKADKTSLYQTFYVNYEAIIYANVAVDLNYPNPTGAAVLNAEFLEDGATFATSKDFVNGKASFAGGNRMVITANKDTGITEKKTVSISEINNVKITHLDTEGREQELTEQDGSNIIYTSTKTNKNGSEVPGTTRESLKFKIKVTDGSEAYVVLRVECNQVIKLYTIKLQKDVYSMQVSTATRNYSAVENVESYYLDELANHRNIFEENRLLNFTLNADLEAKGLLSSTYKFLFKDTTKSATWDGYKVVTIKFNAKEQGQSMNYDLGQSFKAYEFKGIFVGEITGKFSGNNVDILTLASDGKFKFSNGTEPNIVSTALLLNGDNSKAIFNVQPKLLSRIELKYAGNRVVYDKADAIFGFQNNKNTEIAKLSDYTIEQNSTEVDKVLKLGAINKEFTLTLKNGQNESTKITKFGTVSYDYRVALDIGITDALEFTKNKTSNKTELVSAKDNKIFVSQEVDFLYNFGAYKPSQGSGSYLTKEHFKQDNISMKLGVIGLTEGYSFVGTNEYLAAIINEYSASNVSSSIKAPYYENINNRYLAIAGELFGDNHKPINYNVSGIGAGNLGQFVLLKFTYTVIIPKIVNGVTTHEEFSKDFYIMVEVLPDYKIAYTKAGETSAFDDEGNLINGGKITNQDSAPSIMPTLKENTTDKYEYKEDTTLIAGNRDYAMVSVKHGKSSNQRELSANNFTYTLKLGDNELNGVEYNKTTNVANKLAGLLTAGNNWTANTVNVDNIDKIVNYEWKNTLDNALLSIYGVKEVIFGSQNYRMTAVDNYGFTFTICWTLQSRFKDPEFDGTRQVKEGTAFSIGAQYEKLSVNETQEPVTGTNPAPGKFDIANEVNMNMSTETVFNVMNIEAWAFDRTYVNGGNVQLQFAETSPVTALSPAGDAGYNITNESKYGLGDANDNKYLKLPNINYVSISAVKYLDKNNENLAEISSSGAGFGKLKFGDSSDLIYKGLSEGNFGLTKLPMPTFGGHVYGEEGNAEMTMVVTLKYENGDNTEEYDVKVPIIVTKEIDINSVANNIVRDGDQIKLGDYINVIRDNNSVANVEFYDDTLEFNISASQQVKFSVVATDNGKTFTNEEFIIINNDVRPRIFYRSLSSLVGRTLSQKATFTVTVLDKENISATYEDFGVKYNDVTIISHKKGETPPTDRWESNKIEIIASKNIDDKVTVEDSFKFGSSKKLNVTKYYLISVKDNDGKNPKEYQFAQDYVVTPYYYSISRNYSGNEKKVEDYVENEEGIIEMPLGAWTKGMTLNKLTKGGGAESEVSVDTFSNDCASKLHFEVNVENIGGGTPAIGAVTIDSAGKIVTTSAFDKSSHYVVVKIYVKASGMSGDFSASSDKGVLLDTIRLSLYLYDTTTHPVVLGSTLNTNVMNLVNGEWMLQTIPYSLNAGATSKLYANKIMLKAGMTVKEQKNQNSESNFTADKTFGEISYYLVATVENISGLAFYVDSRYTEVVTTSITTVAGDGTTTTTYNHKLKIKADAQVYIDTAVFTTKHETSGSYSIHSLAVATTGKTTTCKVFTSGTATGFLELYGIFNSMFISTTPVTGGNP